MTIPLGSLPPSTLAELGRPLPSPLETPAPSPTGTTGFENRVGELLDSVSNLDHLAADAGDGYLRGAHDDVHGTMIAMQEADVALRFATNIRNRVVEAYREVMRMGG